MKTRTIVVLAVAAAAAIAAAGLRHRISGVAGTENGASDSTAVVAPASTPSPGTTSGADASTEPRAIDVAWQTPSSPSPRYAEPEEIERQLGQFLAEQSGLQVVSLSSIDCGATACEIALTGRDVNPRYVDAYSSLNDKLYAEPWSDFRILYGSLGTREIAPSAREYVISFEYQPLVDLSADPLTAARQYAACAAAWRRLTENPTPDDVARDYLDRAERYVALAASELGEQEAAQVAAKTRGGPLIRECGLR